MTNNHLDLAKLGLGEISKAMLYKFDAENESEAASKIRMMACWVLSTMAQNNPISQQAIVDQGVLPIVLNIITKSKNEQVQQKALAVISAMVRDCTIGQDYFEKTENLSLMHYKNYLSLQMQVW